MATCRRYMYPMYVFVMLNFSTIMNSTNTTTYKMTFQTCDREGAETTEAMHVVLHGDQQNLTFHKNETEFKQGPTEAIFNDSTYLGTICSINIWRSNERIDSWKLSNLTIAQVHQARSTIEDVFEINSCNTEDQFVHHGNSQHKTTSYPRTTSPPSWNPWGECHGICLRGMRNRTHTCSRTAGCGVNCSGDDIVHEKCRIPRCEGNSQQLKWMLAVVGMGVCLVAVIVLSFGGAMRQCRLNAEPDTNKNVRREKPSSACRRMVSVTNWEYSEVDSVEHQLDPQYPEVYSLPNQPMNMQTLLNQPVNTLCVSQLTNESIRSVYPIEIEWSKNEMYDRT